MASDLRTEDEVVNHQVKEMKLRENRTKSSKIKLTTSKDKKVKVLIKITAKELAGRKLHW